MRKIVDEDLEPLLRIIKTSVRKPSGPQFGDGFLVSVNESGKITKPPSGWKWSLGAGKKQQTFLVKNQHAPLVLKGIEFVWNEGTTDIELAFRSNIEIDVRERPDGEKLVALLAGQSGPGDQMYGLIHRELHKVMSMLFSDLQSRGENILGLFGNEERTVATTESEVLNEHVTRAINSAIGAHAFRIGFHLMDAPPSPILIPTSTKIKPKGSDLLRQVETELRMELENYQQFRRSGLTSEHDVIRIMEAAVSEAVHKQFAGKDLYEIVDKYLSSSANEKTEIEAGIQEQVRNKAKDIGYEITIHNTFPRVALLDLKQGLRIDIVDSENEFGIEDSMSKVRIYMSFIAGIGDIEALKNFLSADEDTENLSEIIKQRTVEACKDCLRSVNSQQFNMEFRDKVESMLKERVRSSLARVGVSIDKLKVAPGATEIDERLQAIRKKAIPFDVVILPIGSGGRGDAIRYSANFEVVAVVPGGWNTFDSKGFGFKNPMLLSEDNGSSSDKRRELGVLDAATVELAAIRKRIVDALRGALSTLRNFDRDTRRTASTTAIEELFTRIANAALSKEFGLSVSIFGAVREFTTLEQFQFDKGQTADLIRRENLERTVATSRLQGDAKQAQLKQLLDRYEEMGSDALESVDTATMTEILDQIELLTGGEEALDALEEGDNLPSVESAASDLYSYLEVLRSGDPTKSDDDGSDDDDSA